eukprot:180255-Chlamydomonas_euryale.AAC.3
MIGRAGRAGQSAVGEAFIIGKGGAHAAGSSEWRPICRLMSAPLPELRSSLAGAGSAHAADRSGAGGGKAVAPTDRLAGTVAAQPSSAASAVSACRTSGRLQEQRAAAAGGKGPAGGGAGAAAHDACEAAFQQMMLEGIANGSATTDRGIHALITYVRDVLVCVRAHVFWRKAVRISCETGWTGWRDAGGGMQFQK